MSSTTTLSLTSQPQSSMRALGWICSIGLAPSTSFSSLCVAFALTRILPSHEKKKQKHHDGFALFDTGALTRTRRDVD
jgi:hypothetical protein